MNIPPPGGGGWIVEFVGLPGSGKSTLSHAVAEALRRGSWPTSERSFDIAHRMRPTRRRWVKLRLAGRTMVLRPWTALSLALQVARTGQRSWLEGATKTLDLLYVCGLIAEQARRPGIHLLDQGFFTSVGSICFGASAAVGLDRLIALGTRCCRRPPSDLVVILDVEPATALERLIRRPGATSRLERSVGTAAFARDLQAAVASLQMVQGALTRPEATWGVRIVSGDGSRGAETLVAEIADSFQGSSAAISSRTSPTGCTPMSDGYVEPGAP